MLSYLLFRFVAITPYRMRSEYATIAIAIAIISIVNSLVFHSIQCNLHAIYINQCK